MPFLPDATFPPLGPSAPLSVSDAADAPENLLRMHEGLCSPTDREFLQHLCLGAASHAVQRRPQSLSSHGVASDDSNDGAHPASGAQPSLNAFRKATMALSSASVSRKLPRSSWLTLMDTSGGPHDRVPFASSAVPTNLGYPSAGGPKVFYIT